MAWNNNEREPATNFGNLVQLPPDTLVCTCPDLHNGHRPECLQAAGEGRMMVPAYRPLYESFGDDDLDLAPLPPAALHTWRIHPKKLAARTLTDADAMAFHLVRAHALAIHDGMAVFSTDGIITFAASLDEISNIQLDYDAA